MKDKIEVPKIHNAGLPPCQVYLDRVEAKIDKWRPWGYEIDYCLAERTEQRCSFNGNIPIVAIVIVCNAIKVFIMVLVAIHLPGHPLITVGDALESFLNQPDETTRHTPLLTRQQSIKGGFLDKDVRPTPEQQWSQYHNQSRQVLRWSAAASKPRWNITIGLTVLCLVIVASFFGYSMTSILSQGIALPQLGFGRVVPAAIISNWSVSRLSSANKQIVASILIANLPQLVLSGLYLSINGLLTSMWMASEWSKFVHERKFLRVSIPKGEQRSAHFLSLPYRIAIPLMISLGLLHWLVSQSIFLAVAANYDSKGNLINATSIASCGFSPSAMIAVMISGAAVIGVTIWIGRRKLDSTMPLVGSCSAAISASCHPPDWDVDAAMKAVQYGVLLDQGEARACFTSGAVAPLTAVQTDRDVNRMSPEE